MKKYGIEIDYTTGNSFNSERRTSVLELEWDDLDKAKAALKRIEEHYRWYSDKNNSYKLTPDSIPEPDWHKGMKYEMVLKLIADNGEEFQFSAFWCGYFESLHAAEIIELGDPEMRVEF